MLRRAPFRASQHGMALIMLVFILGLAATAYLIHALDANTVKIERDKKTAAALAEAKAALIGWAVKHQTMPGTLPCPDTNNDGLADSSGSNCSGYIGRLPWRTLGLGDLRDAEGECLWYALSPVFRNTIPVASRTATPLNSGIQGTITLVDSTGNPLPTPLNPAVAVVIAPGSVLAGQNRASATLSVCGGNVTATNYLDVEVGINNATGNVSGVNYTFVTGKASDTFNDKLAFVTDGEMFNALRGRMTKEMLGNTDILAGPADYFEAMDVYPCPAANATGGSNCALHSGYVNNSLAMGLQYASLGTWLANNGWFGLATYSYLSSTHVRLSLADAFGSYTCDANDNVFSCASP